MKKYFAHIGVVVAFLAIGLVTIPLTYAHDLSPAEQRAFDAEQKAAEQRQKVLDARKKEAEAKQAEAKQRLDSLSRKVCDKRQSSIKKSMTRVVDQRQKQIEHIDEIAVRVQAFYTKQKQSLANYDALVTDVAAKKAAAQAAIVATKTDATFSCDSDGPKAQLQLFRNKRTAAIEAINAYRQSVKALIAGVKSVQLDKGTKS